jgi:dipeptidyl aminopeptidase
MHTPAHNGNYSTTAVHNVTALASCTRFLLLHGVADDNVHFQNSLTLLDLLDLNGVENFDVHVFPDSDHGIYFHNANKAVWDKLGWWLTNAFNGVWEAIENPVPLREGGAALAIGSGGGA